MADYYTTLTTTGLAKVVAALSGGPALQPQSMAVGDGGGPSFYDQFDRDALKQRSSLVNQHWSDELNLVDVDPNNPAWVVTEGLIPTQVGGWYIREVGIFDIDGDLIAIGVYPETYKPIATAVEADLLVRSILEVGEAAAVQLKIDPSQVMATREWVLESAIPQALTTLDDAVERAEVARDIAQLAVGIFTTEQEGIDETVADNFFWVALQNDENLVALYKNEAGVADFYGTYPSGKAFGLLRDQLNQAFDLASQPGSLNGEFHGSEEFEFSYAVVSESGQLLMMLDEDGNQVTTWQSDFHSSDSSSNHAMLDEQGNQLIAWDEDGAIIDPWRGEFHSDDSPVASAMIDDAGFEMLAWSDDGKLLSNYRYESQKPAVELIPYLSGSQLRAVGAQDTLAADLGDYTALSIAAGSHQHVRAVLNYPALSSTRTVAAANGYIVPDSDNVLHVIIGKGQSLMTGSVSIESLVSNQVIFPDSVLMFDRADGTADVRMGLETAGSTEYTLTKSELTGFTPLVAKNGQGESGRGETPMESNANTLARFAYSIGASFKTLSFTATRGGTPYENLKKGTEIYNNTLTALSRAKELAAEKGWKIIVDACLVKHGEGDAGNGNYFNDLIEWQADFNADVKNITEQEVDVHFIMGQPSSFYSKTDAARAMLKAHNESEFHHLVGADYPFSDEYGDLVHFTGPGYYHIGEQLARGWKDLLWSSASKTNITQIKSANIVGSTVTLEYECPTPPLVIDTTHVSENDNYGFCFYDDDIEIEINSTSITDDGTTGVAKIELELSSTPSGAIQAVEYALKGHSGDRVEQNIPRGNIRDSAVDVSEYDGRGLYNWAVHQRFEII